MLGPSDSNAIKYTRVICIFFMLFVHVPYAAEAEQYLVHPLNLMITSFTHILALGSVTALSFVSGLLAFHSLSKQNWAGVVKARASTLVLPMVFWNILAIVFGFTVYWLFAKDVGYYEWTAVKSWWQVLFSGVLAIDYGSVTESANFIRDLFVCALLSKPLLFLIRRFGLAVVLGILIWDYCFGFAPFIYRGIILVFYSLGIYAAVKSFRFEQLLPFQYWIYALILLIVVKEWVWPSVSLPLFDLVKRVSVSLLMICIAVRLSQGRRLEIIKSMEPSVFLVYLSHSILFSVSWGVWTAFFGDGLNDGYLAYFLLLPMTVFAIIYSVSVLLAYMPKSIQLVVSGRIRYPRRRHHRRSEYLNSERLP